jgi:creatinine amidohydrolase/Fe(II)-dependent formamide hydrolase-like protein
MPYGTDTLQVEEIGSRACEHAFKQGASVLLLPVIPVGPTVPAPVTRSEINSHSWATRTSAGVIFYFK